jgi:hypothetical protein
MQDRARLARPFARSRRDRRVRGRLDRRCRSSWPPHTPTRLHLFDHYGDVIADGLIVAVGAAVQVLGIWAPFMASERV